MEKIKEEYKNSIYSEVGELSKGKIYIVKSDLDDKIYIKKILSSENREIYLKIQSLDIPNIPKIYEIIDLDNKLVIIEEYINGISLKEMLDKSKTVPEKKVIKYTLELIKILEGLYSECPKIIHRDIKPSNIMINNDGIIKLIDFDISRIYKKDKSTDTNILGTYGYAAPEQFGYNQSDTRTDIYSIGATMNILLTGKLPREEVYKGSLSKIIKKCLELDPNKRFQNSNELKKELLKKYRKYNIGEKRVRSLQLPGFRSSRRIFKIIGFVWYLLLVMLVMGLFENEPISEDRILSILLALFLLSLTLLYGNYRDIQYSLPVINSENTLIKTLGYVLYTMILFIVYSVVLPS